MSDIQEAPRSCRTTHGLGASLAIDETWNEATPSFGLLPALVMVPNILAILASAGRCALRASVPLILRAGVAALEGLLSGGNQGNRLAALQPSPTTAEGGSRAETVRRFTATATFEKE